MCNTFREEPEIHKKVRKKTNFTVYMEAKACSVTGKIYKLMKNVNHKIIQRGQHMPKKITIQTS